MTIHPLLIEILQIAVLLFVAPLFAGWVKMVKCWFQGRTSPSLFQPYRDIRKLFSKDVTLAENASWIFRFTPYLVFGVSVLAGGIIPILSTDLPLSATADVIALVALFAIARFFTALAGMDIGTAFGGMGSSREMTIASLAEPAMLMAVFAVSLVSKSTSLSQMAFVISQGHSLLRPSLVFALLAFVLIALAETGRVPGGQSGDPPGTDDDPRGHDPRIFRPAPGAHRMGRDDEALSLRRSSASRPSSPGGLR